jgi:putative DNA primase/helicase
MNDQTIIDMLNNEASVADLFSGEDGVVYARYEQGDQRVTYPVRSPAFRMWLNQRAMEVGLPLPSARVTSQILSQLEHQTYATTDRYPVCRRFHTDDHSTFVSLDTDQILEVSAEGHEIVGEHGLIFPTDPGMVPLPAPVEEADALGTLSGLFGLDERQTLLVLAWLMGNFQPDGRIPVLIVTGPTGSGTTRLAAAIRKLIDPAQVPLLPFPRKPGDLADLAARNAFLAFDNVQNIPEAYRGAIAAFAEGTSGRDRRTGATLSYKIPTILVCEELSRAGALARDAIVVRLKDRDVCEIKSRAVLDREFSATHARALGALVGLASKAMALRETVELETVFKDAAFERWLLAVDKALTANGKLMETYRRNGQTVLANIVADTPALSGFMSMLRSKGDVTATAKDMMCLIEPFLTEQKGSHWPKTPREFSSLLRASAYAMPEVEIEFGVRTGKARDRMIVARLKVTKAEEIRSAPSAARRVKACKKAPETNEQPCLI